MTATQATDLRAELEARWSAVSTSMIEQRQDGLPYYSIDNAREWYKIERILRRWAVVVYGDHVMDADNGVDSMDEMTGSVHEFIHQAIVAWAEKRHADSAEYWAAQRAEKAGAA